MRNLIASLLRYRPLMIVFLRPGSSADSLFFCASISKHTRILRHLSLK